MPEGAGEGCVGLLSPDATEGRAAAGQDQRATTPPPFSPASGEHRKIVDTWESGPSWSSEPETLLLWFCVALQGPNLISVPFFLLTHTLRRSRTLCACTSSRPDSMGICCAGHRSGKRRLGPPRDVFLGCGQSVTPCGCSIVRLTQEEEGAARTHPPEVESTPPTTQGSLPFLFCWRRRCRASE